MIFALGFDFGYVRMATAVINALNYYHKNCQIIVYTSKSDKGYIAEHFHGEKNLEVIEFVDEGLQFGQWHPLIWAKVEAFRLEIDEPIIFLDADVIIYNNLDKYCDDFRKSGKLIGASKDFAPFVKQFNSGFDFRQFFFNHFFTDQSYLKADAFNAGAMIFYPDKEIYKELISLAKTYDKVTFYPEQAILNLFCLINDSWHALDDFSIMPFSAEILQIEKYGMLHFFTPRPNIMKAPILRDGEPTLEEMAGWFKMTFQMEYPIKKIEKDFFDRLTNNI